MAEFYTIEPCRYNPFYAELDYKTIPYSFERACYSSFFQHIDPYKTLKLGVTPESPEKYSDFMYMKGIPLVSDYMRNIFYDFGIDNILYKKIILENPVSLNSYECWLALPPVIDCLDYERSSFMPYDNDMVEEIVIDSRKTGRYDIFKISDRKGQSASTDTIVLTEKLYRYIIDTSESDGRKLKGVYINELY